jgi:DEAD/DEAH box helicase domain-containing protein
MITKMIDHLVVDVEIQKTIEETPGGWEATDKLGVAVACVWEYTTQRMRIYGPNDVEALRERLLNADRISGYNILNFDFPVIWGFSKPDWKSRVGCGDVKLKLLPKTDDMLRRIWQALGIDLDNYVGKTHGSCKLDDIAGATLGSTKIGNGALAPVWYQQGLIQKVVNYCADDVAIERDLTDFVERYGYVIQNGKQLKIPQWKGGA